MQGNSLDQENHHRSRGANSSSSAETAMSKGKWERRLQTDIHMAKQALCEALSLDNISINLPEISSSISTNPQSQIHPKLELPPPPPPISQRTTTYASSAENIARLLPNWMKKPQKSSQTSSESISTTQTRNSFDGQFPSPPSEGFDNSVQFGFNNYSNYSHISDISQSVSPETTSLFQDESKSKTETAQLPPLSYLEKWLLDDATAQEMALSLEETDGLF